MAYFPPLDKCLTGKEPLVSWHAVLDELILDHGASTQLEIQSFLSSDVVVNTLINCLQPFAGRNDQSRREYEARTAPIHTSAACAASSDSYDIEQFKSDALWLSKELDINEVAALRLVVTEWQARPADLLLDRVFDESQHNGSKAEKNGHNLSDTVRHRRLVQMYLRESSAIKHICAILVALDADRSGPSSTGHEIWISQVAAQIRNARSNKGKGSEKNFTLEIVKDVQTQIDFLEDSRKWPGCIQNDFALHADFSTAILQDMASSIRNGLVHHFHDQGISSSETILLWFKLMQRTNFLQSLEPSTPDQASLSELVQCLVSVFSASLLNLPEAISEIDQLSGHDDGGIAYPRLNAKPYIADDDCIREINLIIFQAAEASSVIAGPALYAWSIITMYIRDLARMEQEALQQLEDGHDSTYHGSVTRRHSVIEQKYDVLQDRTLGSARDDPPQYLARQAADEMNVFAIIGELSRILTSALSANIETPVAQTCRTILFDIIRESLPTVTYDDHIVESVLALLSPESLTGSSTSSFPSLSLRFWKDRTKCYPLLFQQTVARYPYELSPLLRLLSALLGNLTGAADEWSAIVESFEALSSITITLPEGFRGYTLEHEEEGANAFRLLDDLPIFTENLALRSIDRVSDDDYAHQGTDQQAALHIPAGTEGTILRDSRPFIVSLKHKHSGLVYIGLLLTTHTPHARFELAAPAVPIDNFVAADIIHLAVCLLKGASDRSSVEHILEELGAGIPGELDVIAVICELLETELLARAEQATQPGSTELMIQCVRFVHAVSDHYPERMWSYLSQSTLLGNGTGSSTLLATSGTSEDQAKQSRLACECFRLYEKAVDDAVSGLVKRRKPLSAGRSGSRFDSPMDSLGDISERVITQVLTAYTMLALELLQDTQQREIQHQNTSETVEYITKAFQKVLVNVYGIGELVTSSTGIAKVLAATAQIILKAFLPEDLDVQTLAPLLKALQSVARLDSKALSSRHKGSLVSQAKSVLELLGVLLRISRVLDRSADKLVTSLTSSLSMFTSLFALQPPFQKAVAEVLTELVITAGSNTSEPSSIFNQLSQQQGVYFLTLLTRFDSSLTDNSTDCKIWDLFAAAYQYNQQWFAMFLVTGALPKENIKDMSKARKTALSHALDLLSDIKNLNPEKAASVLAFVAEAQKTWPWVTSKIRNHSDFVTNALTWLNELKASSRYSNTADAQLVAKEYRLAACLCDVLAVSIHSSLEIGDKSLSKLVSSKIAFLTQHAARVDGFNQNLHQTLAANIEKRFTGLKLGDLQRTAIGPGSLGDDYKYNIAVAEEMLGHDGSWHGSGRGQAQGFMAELQRANVNWSLYDAQISLLQQWKTLAITLADSNDSDETLTSSLIDTIDSCLTASADTNLRDPEAASLLQLRADLVFTLLSKLVKVPCSNKQTESILQKTWSLVRASPVDYDVAEEAQDLVYYRTLLQILFLCLQLDNTTQARLRSQEQSAETGSGGALVRVDFNKESILVEIMTTTITSGFRALCGNLHGSVECAIPEDFALLIALTKATLAGSSNRQFYSLIADAVAFSAITRSAASLFSWSDHLTDLTAGDPVYGELAIMFLATLSRVPQIAEQMAVENILNQISSANLSNYFRKPGGKGPFDTPSRMFAIWTDGFLPLCLNLIEAVGPPIAPEISSFFSSFPQQLARAEKALQNASPSPRHPRAGAVTLGLVNEARDLIMIARILQSVVALGAAEGVSGDDIEELRYDSKLVGDDLEALTKSQRSLRDRILPATSREAALLNDKSGGSDDCLQAAVIVQIDQALALLKEG